MADHAPLAPLFPERHPPFWSVPTIKAPDWKTVHDEATQFQHQVDQRIRRWPPERLQRIHEETESVFGTLHPGHDVLPLNPWHLAELPSVARYLETVTETIRARDPRAVGMDPATVEALITKPLLFQYLSRRAWAHYGHQVYVIDPETYDLLVQTDLPDYPTTLLKAPLPAFYLKVPEGAFQFTDPVVSQEPVDVEGAIVVFDRPEPSETYSRSISVELYGRASTDRRDTTLYAYAHFGPDAKISEIAWPAFHDGLRAGGEYVAHDVPAAILGLCLYLQSEHPRIEPVPPQRIDVDRITNPGKRRKARQRNERQSAYGYAYVGGGEEERRHQPSPRSGQGYTQTRPSWVRGHWRNQAHGPGHRQRKLIWIKPHRRGPDLADADRVRRQKVQPGRERGGEEEPGPSDR